MASYRDLQKRVIDQLRFGAGQTAGQASIIPMKRDYRNDPAICLTSVSFVPTDLAQEICQAVIAPLKAIEPEHYFYAPDSMHLTIKNIRTVHNPPQFTAADINKVNNLFTQEIPQYSAFSLSLEELVPFKTSLSLIACNDEGLRSLVKTLDSGLNRIGIPDNKMYITDDVFFGNVTVCRYVQPPSRHFLQTVDQMAQVFKSELAVEMIHLITCNAVCAPESRNVIASYKLKPQPR
jgi:2'-5' RNA ligase